MWIEKLIDKLIDISCDQLIPWAQSELSRILNLDSDLQSLANTRRRIDTLLSDADRRVFAHDGDDSVHLWLRELQSISFHSQDIDEEFTALKNSRKRKRSPFFFKKHFSNRIASLQQRYDEISEDRKKLKLRAGAASSSRVSDRIENFQESSALDETQVVGREVERGEIVGLLINYADCEDLAVVSITGCAGIGKSVLARMVFDDMLVQEVFDLKIWVGLYEGLGVMDVTRKIIGAAEREDCRLTSFDLMQYKLRQIVRNKRVLIVLDNVWNEEMDFWDKLRVPFMGNGVRGSKVLVTTRSEIVSGNMKARQFCLLGLPFDHCRRVFFEQAITREQASKVLKVNPELERIGLEIVRKCQGLPVLVKSIASLLYSEIDEYEWKCVLDEMPEYGEASKGIVPTLRVSYDHLPPHLKCCFAFCSIFPAGYEFDKDQLVKLWMALGFIKPNGRRRVEDIGGRYFTNLLWRSFFHASDSFHNKDKPMFTMPSVIHDLAKSVSKFESSEKDAPYIILPQCNMEPVISEGT